MTFIAYSRVLVGPTVVAAFVAAVVAVLVAALVAVLDEVRETCVCAPAHDGICSKLKGSKLPPPTPPPFVVARHGDARGGVAVAGVDGSAAYCCSGGCSVS